jgi:hypothetical protein
MVDLTWLREHDDPNFVCDEDSGHIAWQHMTYDEHFSEDTNRKFFMWGGQYGVGCFFSDWLDAEHSPQLRQ